MSLRERDGPQPRTQVVPGGLSARWDWWGSFEIVRGNPLDATLELAASPQVRGVHTVARSWPVLRQHALSGARGCRASWRCRLRGGGPLILPVRDSVPGRHTRCCERSYGWSCEAMPSSSLSSNASRSRGAARLLACLSLAMTTLAAEWQGGWRGGCDLGGVPGPTMRSG